VAAAFLALLTLGGVLGHYQLEAFRRLGRVEDGLGSARREREAAQAVAQEAAQEAAARDRKALQALALETRERLSSLGRDLEAEQAAGDLLLDQLRGLREELGGLSEVSDAAAASLGDLDQRVEAARARDGNRAEEISRQIAKLEGAERALAELRSALTAAEARSDKLSRDLSGALAALAPAPRPAGGGAASAPPPVGGSGTPEVGVAAASRPEAKVELVQERMVVVAAGAKAGVEVGAELEIRRDGRRIAKATVSRVYPDYSGARVTVLEEGMAVRAGDVAVLPPR
jgi:hypothetical protein